MSINTIDKVIRNDLCLGCGTCVGLCPNRAIKMELQEKAGVYSPMVNHLNCKECGICYKVCPGHRVDFEELNLAIFNKKPEDILLGNYLQCYLGYSKDEDIRYNSSSGGVVTSLLVFALEKGIIDGALVTRMSRTKPLEAEPFIARTKEEIIEAAKSKYCPVPANIVLNEIVKTDGKYAVVGLPCHMHGIRKAALLNPKLAERVVLHLGIFCSKTPTFMGTEYLLYKNNLRKDDVKEISYRGDGWPGRLTLIMKSGEKHVFSFSEMWGRIASFYSKRCSLCCDQSSKLADISFGDAWLTELSDDSRGTSVIVSRTTTGGAILDNMVLSNNLFLNKVPPAIIKRSQNYFAFKNNIGARMTFLRLLGNKIPAYNVKLTKPKITYIFSTPLTYVILWLSSKRYLWVFLSFIIYLSSGVRKVARYFMQPASRIHE